jgi:hypothetical protein
VHFFKLAQAYTTTRAFFRWLDKVGKVIGIVYRGQIVNGRIAGRQLETNLDGHMITVAVIDEIVPFPRSSDVGDMT